MSSDPVITKELISQALMRLRPVDLSLGIKVYSGSPLDPRPSLDELMRPEARLFWLGALTSYAQSQSHSGLHLGDSVLLEDCLPVGDRLLPGGSLKLVDFLGTGEGLIAQYPDKCVQVEEASQRPAAPFVFRSGADLVYLHRWYAVEAELGAIVRERLARATAALPPEFGAIFSRFFTRREVEGNPWQAVACLSAVLNDFSMITGGPGTGKTTTITRLIGLLLSLPEVHLPKKIKMVAPTGKAAERMREAFAENFEKLMDQLPQAEADQLRERGAERIEASSTIHSFLGYRGRGGFHHHAGNPFSCDVLIVDEATMVDLDLFLSLFRAVPDGCRVILLGDKNQLAAVETGNVFSDLTATTSGESGGLNAFSPSFCDAFESLSGQRLAISEGAPPLCGDKVTELETSYRFRGDSEVGQLARLLLSEERLPREGELPLCMTSFQGNWQQPLFDSIADYREALARGADAAALLEKIGEVRILCAVRSGEHGVEAINRLLCDSVFGTGLDPRFPRHGLPFIILSNDRTLGLWNGDCGVFREDAAGVLTAYLPPRTGGESIRKFDPYSLPDWEAAFALTIHKSQGSEYQAVVVVLPEMTRKFITWELVYTGITRGRERVGLVLPRAQFGAALPRTRRVSGLSFEIQQG